MASTSLAGFTLKPCANFTVLEEAEIQFTTVDAPKMVIALED
jgi:hypothetical protein